MNLGNIDTRYTLGDWVYFIDGCGTLRRGRVMAVTLDVTLAGKDSMSWTERYRIVDYSGDDPEGVDYVDMAPSYMGHDIDAMTGAYAKWRLGLSDATICDGNALMRAEAIGASEAYDWARARLREERRRLEGV